MFLRYTFITSVLGLLLTAVPANSQHTSKSLAGAAAEYPEGYETIAEISEMLDRTAEAVDSELKGAIDAPAFIFSAILDIDAYLLETQLSQTWDSQSSSWVNENLVTYTRGSDGGTTELLIEDWDIATESWVNSTRRVYNVNDAEATSETLDQSWNPEAAGGLGDWEPVQRRISTFNEQGETLVSTTEIWDSDTAEYMLWTRTTSTYDASGTMLQTYLSESSLLGPIAPRLRYTFTYHANGLRASRLHESYSTTTQAFRNSGFRHYTYDSNGEEILDLEQDWDENANDWVDDYRTTTEFTPNSANATSIVETEQSWDTGSGAWVNEEREVSTIGSSEITVTQQDWDPTASGGQGDWVNIRQSIQTLTDGKVVGNVEQEWAGGTWINVERDTIEYDDRSLAISSLTEEWDGNAWVNATLLTMTYKESGTSTAADSDRPVAGYKLEGGYPNPFSTASTIGFTLPEPAYVTVEVLDMLGRRVELLVETTLSAGTHSVTLRAGDLPAGFYMYRLASERFQSSKSLLLIK